MKSAVRIGALAAVLSAASFSAHAVTLDINPLVNNFGSVTLGNSTAPFDFTLTAKDLLGNQTVTGWDLTIAGTNKTSFQFSPVPSCGASATCIVSILFAPVDLGPLNALLLVTLHFNFDGARTLDGSATLLGNGSAIDTTPLPGALPLFATGLGVLGLIAHRRRKHA